MAGLILMYDYQSARYLTKYHRLDSLNIRDVLLPVLEAGKPRVQDAG